MSSRTRTLIALGAAAALLAGCATSGSNGAGGGDAKPGTSITVGTTDKVISLDPAASYDNGSFMVMNQVYPFLVNTLPGAKDTVPTPDITESVAFTSATEVTAKLKPNLTFANGHALTSSDVKFSFDRMVKIADPNGPASLLGNLASVSAPDATTVVFKLKSENDQTFVHVLSSPAAPIIDEEVFPADAILPNDKIAAAKPFAGQYSIDSYSDNELISFTAFDGYKGSLGAAKTAKVTMKYYAESSNMRLDVEQSNIDVAYRSLSSTDVESLAKNKNVTIHEGPGGEIRYIVFNFDSMPFGATQPDADPAKALAVRQAVANLVDRQQIATQVYKDTYSPLWSYIPDGLPGNGDQFKTLYTAGGKPDKDAAAKLLKDAGIATPLTLKLQYNPDHYGPSSGDEYAMVKSQLEASGLFKVDLQSTEWVQYSKDRVKDLYPMYQLGWFPDYSDADNYLTPFFVKDNFLANHYDNAEVQALLAKQLVTTNKEERAKLFTEIQDKLAHDISTLPLLQGKQVAVSGKSVKGVNLNASFKFLLGQLTK